MVQKYVIGPPPGPLGRGLQLSRGLEVDDPTPAPLSIRVDAAGERAVVAVVGELDIAGMTHLSDQLATLLSQGRVQVVLDLAGLVFCDMSGLRVLIRYRRRAAELGGWLRLAELQPQVARLLELAHVARMFAVFTTVADAAA